MPRTKTSAYLHALGRMIAELTPEEQLDFFHAFIAGHDRLADQIHREVRGREDRRPVLHDKVARALTELRDYVAKQ